MAAPGTIVIGAGPAGLRCADRLAEAGQAVCVIGTEPGLPYNRVALSQLLAGDYNESDLITHDAERLKALARANSISINKLMDELATVALANYDARVRFETRAARGDPKRALALLDKLDRADR